MPVGKFKNFADCVRKNTGKTKDPKAYCATIMKKAEGNPKSKIKAMVHKAKREYL